MSDYYTYHRAVIARKRRRRALIAVLVVLLLLCACAVAACFLAGAGVIRVPGLSDRLEARPTGAGSAPASSAAVSSSPVASKAASSQAASSPASSVAASDAASTAVSDAASAAAPGAASQAASQPAGEAGVAIPAGYAPKRLQDPVDTAAWDTLTPVAATLDMGYYNTDSRMVAVPELGTVDRSYFNTVTLVGDSLTEGFGSYQVLPAFCAGYRNAGPEPIRKDYQLKNYAMGGEMQYALTTIAESQPDYLYITLGTNALVVDGEDAELKFVKDFENLVNTLHEKMPGVILYIESIPGVQPEATEKHPGLDNARIQRVNNMLANMALRTGCYFLNNQEALCTADGVQLEEYKSKDGIHLNPTGYRVWAEYMSTHTVWDRRSVYVGASPYYIYGR